jgi:hypothetical protein
MSVPVPGLYLRCRSYYDSEVAVVALGVPSSSARTPRQG